MAENLDSAVITSLDATPPLVPVTGQGAEFVNRVVTDFVKPLTGAINSTYRMCRFPTNAILKRLIFLTDTAIDTGSANTLVIDFNVAFSDSTQDGTSAANQALLPTTANTGAVTSAATYSSPNKIFGTWTQSSASAAVNTDLTVNGTNYSLVALMNTPLWQIFGFSQEPNGMFDILLKVTTGVNTINASGVNIGVRLEYAV